MTSTTLPGVLLTGTHASRPAANAVGTGTLYSCSTHSLIYQSDGSSWSTWATLTGTGLANPMTTKGDLIVGDTAGAAIRKAIGTDGQVLTADAASTGGMKWAAAGGSSAEDPVATMLGTPDTAFEFASSSLTGLTAIGTATAEDAHTTVPDHYYVKKAATATVALTGRYAAVSAPCTVVTKLKGHNVFGLNFTRLGGLFVGVTTPGRVDAIHVVYNGGFFASVVAYTNPTTFSATIGTDLVVAPQPPIYYAIVATSTTNVAYYYSFDGYVWKTRTTGRDPSMTIGSAGIVVDPEQATHDVVGVYEYLRIWNSAKTLRVG
jgi:hypothetical protein